MADGLADLCDPLLQRICHIGRNEELNNTVLAGSICLMVCSKVLTQTALKNRVYHRKKFKKLF